jgi:hypothetical protein
MADVRTVGVWVPLNVEPVIFYDNVQYLEKNANLAEAIFL